jgi:transcriptional regulator with XRE-family HTH domain
VAQPRLYNERSAQPVDAHVGKRIRMRRVFLNISQEKLAEMVGVTFQQVQKYERGANRIAASRLLEFSKALDVEVDFFYEGLPEAGSKKSRHGLSDNAQQALGTDDRLYSKETLELLKVFYSVKNERKRRELLKIIRSMAENIQSG